MFIKSLRDTAPPLYLGEEGKNLASRSYQSLKGLAVPEGISSIAAGLGIHPNMPIVLRWIEEMDTNNTGRIVNSWSLLAFAKSHGRMKVTKPMTHVNTQTGEEFTATSCAFVHPTEKDEQGRASVCFVGFSRNLGELSASQIAARQNDLQVVQLDNGRFTLCENGAGWDEVALDL